MRNQQEIQPGQETYAVPGVEVLEMKTGGIICVSGDTEPYEPGDNYVI